MIRHTTTSYQNQDKAPSNRISSIPFYSAIKSKKFESLNHRKQTNVTMSATMPKFHFYFNDNENSHFDNTDANIDHKNLGIGSFRENCDDDDDNTGRIANHYLTADIREHMTMVAPTYPHAQNKVLEPYSGTFDDLLATVSNDSDDRMFFPLDDLENDLPIITDQNQKLIANGSSPNFDQLDLRYWPSVPPPSASSDVRMFSNTSSRLDSTSPCTTWLKQELSIDSSTARVTNTNIDSPLLEDSDNASRLNSVTKKYPLIGKNDEIAAQFSYQPGETSHKGVFASTRHKHWTRKEDEILRHAIAEEGNGKIVWCKISELYFRESRSAAQCKVRWNNHVQPGIVRGEWGHHEDQIILKMVSDGCTWKKVANVLPGRTNESIRYRYVNQLDPKLKKTPWNKVEDDILFATQSRVGNKWSEIGKLLPGRSDNAVKNRYYNKKNSYLRKTRQAKKVKSENDQVQVKSENDRGQVKSENDRVQSSAELMREMVSNDIDHFAPRSIPFALGELDDVVDNVVEI
uniref:Uncharacterized protein n=1 Tax=Pseudo-nitzschia australis TaxID=44445 RepID=A0A7S4AA48_9STRA